MRIKILMKKENKALLKYFILVFAISFLVINWNDVSWLFNYKAISGLVSGVFESKIIAKSADVSGKKETAAPLKSSESSSKENSVEVPKLGISAPLVISESAQLKDFSKLLDQGVVYFPGSVLPGEAGQTIILGHSAPENWPKIKYDWVFTRISELTEGDEIFVYFNHRKYSFLVSGKFFLDRGEEMPKLLTNSDNMLVLISCWPPGKDLRRIAVVAK